jgi:repressor LexA
MPRDKRHKRDLHALDDEGMVLCNPRDKEAAHRAQMEGIATDDCSAVTCRKCLSLLHKLGKGDKAGSMAEADPTQGVLHTSDGKITWFCPFCEQNGVISDRQGTQRDHTGEAGKTGAAVEPKPAAKYTPKEGQYLAFIYYYAKLHRQAPAERDMQVYFQVTPPAVHDMVVKLEKHGLISREPGVPRSIKLLLKREELPDLE